MEFVVWVNVKKTSSVINIGNRHITAIVDNKITNSLFQHVNVDFNTKVKYILNKVSLCTFQLLLRKSSSNERINPSNKLSIPNFETVEPR